VVVCAGAEATIKLIRNEAGSIDPAFRVSCPAGHTRGRFPVDDDQSLHRGAARSRTRAGLPGVMKLRLELLLTALSHDQRRKLFSVLRPGKFRAIQRMRTAGSADSSAYTFEPFDRYQCIFVHIPKTAGVSICRTLFGNLAGGHTALQRYQVVFDKNDFDRYFKFAFVRNPWDRLYSAYRFLVRGGMGGRDGEWAKRYLSAYPAFDRFVMEAAGRREILRYKHFTPQVEFLRNLDSGEVTLDFLGYFENLQGDFAGVAERIRPGEAVELARQNASVPSGKETYLDRYSNEMIEKVALVYEDDIRMFGYRFDNGNLAEQIRTRDRIYGV